MGAVTLKEFRRAFAHDREAVICFGDQGWQASCSAGILVNPDGQNLYLTVEQLLADLATIGVREVLIENPY